MVSAALTNIFVVLFLMGMVMFAYSCCFSMDDGQSKDFLVAGYVTVIVSPLNILFLLICKYFLIKIDTLLLIRYLIIVNFTMLLYDSIHHILVSIIILIVVIGIKIIIIISVPLSFIILSNILHFIKGLFIRTNRL